MHTAVQMYSISMHNIIIIERGVIPGYPSSFDWLRTEHSEHHQSIMCIRMRMCMGMAMWLHVECGSDSATWICFRWLVCQRKVIQVESSLSFAWQVTAVTLISTRHIHGNQPVKFRQQQQMKNRRRQIVYRCAIMASINTSIKLWLGFRNHCHCHHLYRGRAEHRWPTNPVHNHNLQFVSHFWSILCGQLALEFGRKKVISAAAICSCCAELLMASTCDVAVILCVVPVLVSVLALPHLRHRSLQGAFAVK